VIANKDLNVAAIIKEYTAKIVRVTMLGNFIFMQKAAMAMKLIKINIVSLPEI